ncbi:hypothetical protein Ancab_024009 [Ancistrocladus abbreviatus]
MRIRRSNAQSVSACSSPSFTFCSTNSTISSHSLASSSNSTSSYFLNSSHAFPSRCEGLDLLVKAVYYVAGSAVGVPYIQRRVIRRRKRALCFSNLIVTVKDGEQADPPQEQEEEEGEKLKRENEIDDYVNLEQQKKRQRRRAMALPSKYQDSVVLHPWKPRYRGRRSSSKI